MGNRDRYKERMRERENEKIKVNKRFWSQLNVTGFTVIKFYHRVFSMCQLYWCCTITIIIIINIITTQHLTSKP